jgi:hypothetical protein
MRSGQLSRYPVSSEEGDGQNDSVIPSSGERCERCGGACVVPTGYPPEWPGEVCPDCRGTGRAPQGTVPSPSADYEPSEEEVERGARALYEWMQVRAQPWFPTPWYDQGKRIREKFWIQADVVLRAAREPAGGERDE